ncbi:MAG: NHL repeat-containing protein [Thermodesulfobacteriota bacterium]|nr:NHL repeat-containing protein [Thermodesulfobacteriota bacterium]
MKNHLLKLIIFLSVFIEFLLWSICHSDDLQIIPLKHLFYLEACFTMPSDVVVGKANKIYVLDGVNHQVKVFGKGGRFLYSFGKKGNKKGEFFYPLGLGVDKDGLIYVADSGNMRVQAFDPAGDYINHFVLEKRIGRCIPDPTDVAIDSIKKRLYVVDNHNHEILVYSSYDKRFLSYFGTKGEKEGCFHFPFFLTTEEKGNVYVVDVLNARFQIFSPLGRLISAGGVFGVEPGQFYRPKGIAIDGKKRIFVTDSYLGTIQIFNDNGQFKGIAGDNSGNILHLNHPMGLFIDDEDRLLVVEMTANKVSVFKIFD